MDLAVIAALLAYTAAVLLAGRHHWAHRCAECAYRHRTAHTRGRHRAARLAVPVTPVRRTAPALPALPAPPVRPALPARANPPLPQPGWATPYARSRRPDAA